MIDPACGSGHFLLGAFDRLFDLWMSPQHAGAHNGNPVVAAQNALDAVHGVDINPYAIAITRFRLLVAAVVACKIKRLHHQSYAWRLNLAVGDSLLWGAKPAPPPEWRVQIGHQQDLFEPDPLFAVEDRAELRRILGQCYHVVVGNPPYITVKDKAKNALYRDLYPQTCYRQYSLGVPFTQRFWELVSRTGEPTERDEDGEPTAISHEAGFFGLITANSFMKREFGKKLIQEFFPKADLTHVLDTSGAYIPGHGTPTVILLGRARKPVEKTVRSVLGIKGEPATPDNPAKGLVWQSILQNVDRAGVEDRFTSTADIEREVFAEHPWSLSGGGATQLQKHLDDTAVSILGDHVESIGYMCITKQDDVFPQQKVVLDRGTLRFREHSPLRGRWRLEGLDAAGRSLGNLPLRQEGCGAARRVDSHCAALPLAAKDGA